jgi:hypothetical protein
MDCQIINIENPISPAICSSIDANSVDIDVSGNTVYVANYANRLTIYDVTNHAIPVKKGEYRSPGNPCFYRVVAHNDSAFISESGNVSIINVANSSMPLNWGNFRDTTQQRFQPNSVALKDDTAFISDMYYGADIVQIHDSVRLPVLMASYDTPGRSFNLNIKDNYAYIADGYTNSGLQIVDITNPLHPVGKGSCPLTGIATAVTVNEEYAYVTEEDGSGETNLHVIDLDFPSYPEIVGSCHFSGRGYAVDIFGSYVYVATGQDIQIIDVSIPEYPLHKNSFTMPNDVTGIEIKGNYAFVSNVDVNGCLMVVDISNPTVPSIVASCPTPGSDYALAIDNDLAYMVGISALHIVDISNPLELVVKGSCGLSDPATSISIVGGFAIVGGSVGAGSALFIIDVSNITAPIIVHTYSLPEHPYDIKVADGYAYVANGTYGLRVFRHPYSK